MGDNNKVILAMIMKTSLNTKGQTVEWHTLFFLEDMVLYKLSSISVYQCNLFTSAVLLIYYKTR